MPLKLNVGLSRKIGEPNYGSRGASVNVEMELESDLVHEPVRLQERIRQLFGVVRSSLATELNGHGKQANGQEGGVKNGEDGGNAPRPATQSQIKAIYAIARVRKLNVGQLVRERFQMGRVDDLSLREASMLIDELKNSGSGNGE